MFGAAEPGLSTGVKKDGLKGARVGKLKQCTYGSHCNNHSLKFQMCLLKYFSKKQSSRGRELCSVLCSKLFVSNLSLVYDVLATGICIEATVEITHKLNFNPFSFLAHFKWIFLQCQWPEGFPGILFLNGSRCVLKALTSVHH